MCEILTIFPDIAIPTRKAIQYIHRYFRGLKKTTASANDGMLSGMRFASETGLIGREFSASVRDGWKAFLLGSVSRR
jgi:hypothetical protein